MNKDVTIITVAGPSDEEYIRANIALIKQMNPGNIPRIVVVDNGKTSPSGDGIKGILEAEIIDGVLQDESLPNNCRGSYQHSSALNRTIRSLKIDTRYLLIVDPDFYTIQPNWISLITTEMLCNNLAFFGAPWHPKWYTKYRYFPCVHYMWIDTSIVDIKTLDFMPNLTERAIAKNQSNVKNELKNNVQIKKPKEQSYIIRKIKSLRSMVFNKFNNFSKIFASFTSNRRYIGSSNDTGYMLHKKYCQLSDCNIGLLRPYMPKEFINAPRHLKYRILRKIEDYLPDRLRFIPRDPNYFTHKGFSYYGFPDVSYMQWEEFLWNDAPFGFHLRRFNKKIRNMEEELYIIRKMTEAIAKVF